MTSVYRYFKTLQHQSDFLEGYVRFTRVSGYRSSTNALIKDDNEAISRFYAAKTDHSCLLEVNGKPIEFEKLDAMTSQISDENTYIFSASSQISDENRSRYGQHVCEIYDVSGFVRAIEYNLNEALNTANPIELQHSEVEYYDPHDLSASFAASTPAFMRKIEDGYAMDNEYRFAINFKEIGLSQIEPEQRVTFSIKSARSPVIVEAKGPTVELLRIPVPNILTFAKPL